MLNLIAAIRDLIEGDPSVRKVAEDPALTAELLLLFRLMLADGSVTRSELETFRAICRDGFGIEEDSFGKVMRFLKDFGYETSTDQSIEAFRDLPPERRRALAGHIAAIVGADGKLDMREFRIVEKVSDMLGLDAAAFAPRTAG